QPIRIVADPYPYLGLAPEWVDVARSALAERVGAEKVDAAGVTVVTTADLDAQKVAREALQAGLRAYDKRQKYGIPTDHFKPDKVAGELARLTRKLPRGGPVAGEEYRALVVEVKDEPPGMAVDLGGWRGSVSLAIPAAGADPDRFNPDRLPPSKRFQPGDEVRVMTATGDHVAALASGPEGAAGGGGGARSAQPPRARGGGWLRLPPGRLRPRDHGAPPGRVDVQADPLRRRHRQRRADPGVAGRRRAGGLQPAQQQGLEAAELR